MISEIIKKTIEKSPAGRLFSYLETCAPCGPDMIIAKHVTIRIYKDKSLDGTIEIDLFGHTVYGEISFDSSGNPTCDFGDGIVLNVLEIRNLNTSQMPDAGILDFLGIKFELKII